MEDILQLAQSCADESHRVLMRYFGDLTQVNYKKNAGLVSEADLESERVICEKIRTHFPDHFILAEEESFKKPSEGQGDPMANRWIIDPLDGTTNYVHNFPLFCTSIGFETQGEVQVGVIDVPILNKRYSAIRGQGVFCNGERIFVSGRKQLSDSLLSTGFFSENKAALDESLRIFNSLVRGCRGVRRTGSAAYDLCMVAEGIFDAFWEANLSPWDTAAGSLFVLEAGGQVTNYGGKPFRPQMKSILATNGCIHSNCQGEMAKELGLSPVDCFTKTSTKT